MIKVLAGRALHELVVNVLVEGLADDTGAVKLYKIRASLYNFILVLVLLRDYPGLAPSTHVSSRFFIVNKK